MDGAAGGGGEERLSWDQGWNRLLWSLWWQPPRRLKRRVSLTVAVDEEVAAKARELARARGVSLSALLREAIAQYVTAAAGSAAEPQRPDPAAAGSQRGAPPAPPPPELPAALLERLDRIERRLEEVERMLRSIPAAAGPPAPVAAPPEPALPDFVRGNPWLSVIAGRGG